MAAVENKPVKVIGGIVYSNDGKFGADNQKTSTASTVAAIVADFNALLVKLKAAGLMEPDAE